MESKEPVKQESLGPNDLLITTPKRCNGCGKKTANMTSRLGEGWIILAQIRPGVVLFGCPNCQTVVMNQDAPTNIDHINKREGSKIIIP